jgi:hypothetical protein
MRRSRLGLPKERLVPFEAGRNVSDADDRPNTIHNGSSMALTYDEQTSGQPNPRHLQEQSCVLRSLHRPSQFDPPIVWSSPWDKLQPLLDVYALQELKGRYFLFLDTKDWSRWLAIRDLVVPSLDKTPTVHHGHTPIFEFQTETEASGIWAMEDIVEFTDNTLHGHGHYRETYRKVGGEWRFASVHLTRLRVVATDRC